MLMQHLILLVSLRVFPLTIRQHCYVFSIIFGQNLNRGNPKPPMLRLYHFSKKRKIAGAKAKHFF